MCVRVKIQSGLGKLILKEEMEKEQIRERHARSLSAQRYDPKQTNCDTGTRVRCLLKHDSISDLKKTVNVSFAESKNTQF